MHTCLSNSFLGGLFFINKCSNRCFSYLLKSNPTGVSDMLHYVVEKERKVGLGDMCFLSPILSSLPLLLLLLLLLPPWGKHNRDS